MLVFRRVAPFLANSVGVVASAPAPVKVYVRLLQPGLRIRVISTRIRTPSLHVSGSGDEEAEDRLMSLISSNGRVALSPDPKAWLARRHRLR